MTDIRENMKVVLDQNRRIHVFDLASFNQLGKIFAEEIAKEIMGI